MFIDAINLLPWRERRRTQEKRRCLYAMGLSVFITLVVMMGIHVRLIHRLGRIKTQQVNMARYAKDPSEQWQESKNTYHHLADQLRTMRRHQVATQEKIAFLMALGRKIPRLVITKRIEVEKDRVQLSICSRSTMLASQLVHALRKLAFVRSARLSALRREKESELMCFDLGVDLARSVV